MYMRFVRLKVKEGAGSQFEEVFRQKVMPALEATDGCLFVGLLRPWRGEEFQGVTLWQSPEHARAYEDSGLYHRLLREVERYLAESTAWRVRLAEAAPEGEETGELQWREIPPEGYQVGLASDPETLSVESPSTYVRIVSHRVDPDRLEEFRRIYTESVMPVLRKQKGCRGVWLVEGARKLGDVLSISLWDREEDAVRYEVSGEFERLADLLRDTFSPIYDWRLSLGAGEGRAGTPEVEGFHLVAAKRHDPKG